MPMTTITVKLVGGRFDGAESEVCKEHPPLYIGILIRKGYYAVYERGSFYRYNYRTSTTVEPTNLLTHEEHYHEKETAQ